MAPADLFLTHRQAIEAVQIDFRQYHPQLLLFGEVLRLISNGTIHYQRDPDKPGAWINAPGRRHMRWFEGAALSEYVCHALAKASLDLDQVATLCARVFQSRAYVGQASGSSVRGIFIETGMEKFTCRQCGRCCRELDYHNELTQDDVQRWMDRQRHDILEWVGVFKHREHTAYRIWMQPGTRQLASQCPFLKQHPSQSRWSCTIHDAKPAICRNYPVSRKHAFKTGCRGFD